MDSAIIQIGDFLVSSDVITEFFFCDYQKCKGACCIIGDSGAPLAGEEAEQIERNYSGIKNRMSRDGRKKVEESGFFEIDIDGDMVTPLLHGSEECAYTCFKGKDCLCAIELAHIEGKSSFVKPISCRLYPIRASVLSNGLTALNLHRWDICKDAFVKGKRENIHVYQFLKEPLIAAYGEEFYEELSSMAEQLLEGRV